MSTTTRRNDTLATRNPEWGFHGTMERAGENPDTAWAIAFPRILEATHAAREGVRDFLDSRMGRHFADEVANRIADGLALAPAIEAAIARYQGWRIGRRTAREHGIPMGLPFLTGWVGWFEIGAEMEAEVEVAAEVDA